MESPNVVQSQLRSQLGVLWVGLNLKAAISGAFVGASTLNEPQSSVGAATVAREDRINHRPGIWS